MIKTSRANPIEVREVMTTKEIARMWNLELAFSAQSCSDICKDMYDFEKTEFANKKWKMVEE